MFDIYRKAKTECDYPASRLLQMLVDSNDGVAVAKSLIMKDGGTDGFTKLWEKRRLDLSVEALVIKAEYTDLFTEEERKQCIDRLREFGYL